MKREPLFNNSLTVRLQDDYEKYLMKRVKEQNEKNGTEEITFAASMGQRAAGNRKAFTSWIIKLLLPEIGDENDNDFNECSSFHSFLKLSIK